MNYQTLSLATEYCLHLSPKGLGLGVCSQITIEFIDDNFFDSI